MPQVSAATAVFDAFPNAIVAVDANARLSYVNPQAERTFGYEPRELLGQPIEVLLPARLAERHVAHRTAFIAHPAGRPMGIALDLAGRRKDGSEFPVEISLSPIQTASGLRVFATIVDISARKSMESELLQAQKLESIGRLAGGIAHDFNNMLFAIRGYVELLEEDLAPDRRADFDLAEAARSVAAIGQAADRAADLTLQLLAFSRQQVVRPQVINMNDAVRAVEPMLRPLIGENVTLGLKLQPGIGRVRADAGQLDQILVNLVVNARDAIDASGIVTIETGDVVFDEPVAIEHFDLAPGPYVLLSVSDTGVGMSRETKDHIFEPFFTTKSLGKGTGLGLATIYGIVRQAGGHIWLYSEPGLGSTFKLYFPRVDDIVETLPPPQPAIDAPAGGTVLVVEDEAEVREMLAKLIMRAGYAVITAADGLEALEIEARNGRPIDVLVSDVVMPHMSGIDLAEQMAERRPNIGIVLLSGYTAETLDLQQAMRRGARFVPKPVPAGELRRAISEVIAATRRAGVGS
jgi:two-component system, cell cycle sensor histidine kinase and response regulator CckA